MIEECYRVYAKIGKSPFWPIICAESYEEAGEKAWRIAEDMRDRAPWKMNFTGKLLDWEPEKIVIEGIEFLNHRKTNNYHTVRNIKYRLVA